MMRSYRKMIGRALLTATLLVSSLALAAEVKQPVGTISIDETQIGLLMGGDFGAGTLTFHGKTYPFKLKGLGEAASGSIEPNMNATGEVYDLKEVSQFPGVYTKLETSIALGGGTGGLRLKNKNGVILSLHSTQGIELGLERRGVTVTMDR
ncbi:MAG: DUF1134 domain-containing protein [Candidatus Contendobacter sp.]